MKLRSGKKVAHSADSDAAQVEASRAQVLESIASKDEKEAGKQPSLMFSLISEFCYLLS